jgi:hypothetical protein
MSVASTRVAVTSAARRHKASFETTSKNLAAPPSQFRPTDQRGQRACHLRAVELWALFDSCSTDSLSRVFGDAIEVYVGERRARKALAAILRDEPDWSELLSVAPMASVELWLN